MQDPQHQQAMPSAASANPATLKLRRDFLRVAAARRKWAMPGLVLQAAPQPKNLDATRLAHPTAAPGAPPGALRFGLTVSKKVGKAVTRNRARRRLRALALSVLAQEAAPGHDYVLIGRGATPDRAFSALQSDLRAALTRLKLLRKPEDAQR